VAAWVVLLLGVLACGRERGNPLVAAEARGGRPDAAWRSDPIWEDGGAEFCVYAADWRRYGNLYPGRVLVVLVKEPWAPDLDVKADQPRADGFDVLKLQLVRDVATGIYTYHQAASVYFRRDSGQIVKLAATSSEECGVSTALLKQGRLETHSYFDGEGDRAQDFPPAAVPEDALPALLRDYVRGEPPPTLSIFPLLLMGRYARLAPVTYTVHKRARGALEVPAGSFDAVEIELVSGDTTLAYDFDSVPPFRLLRFHGSDGTEYRLAKGERLRYWEMHDPGGEAWLPADLQR
jgi:hypothetical protein